MKDPLIRVDGSGVYQSIARRTLATVSTNDPDRYPSGQRRPNLL